MTRSLYIALAVLIVFGAAFLRIADLHRYPPGLHYDEAADMLLSRDIAFYGYNPFPVVTAYSGREALFYYIAAPMLRIFGTDVHSPVMATRLTSAFLGTLTAAATIALGRAMFRNRAVALYAGAWIAVSAPQVWLTRQGFRTSPQPFLEAAGLWLMWVALNRTRHWIIAAIAGGVLCGATLYVYMAARVFPPFVLCMLVLIVVVDAQRRGLRLRQAAVIAAAMIVTAIPIIMFYATNPDVFLDRLNQLAPTGSTVTIPDSIRMHLEMFFLRGDPLLRYNIGVSRPWFDPVGGVLMLIGFGAALWMLIKRDSHLRIASTFVLLCPALIAPSVIAVNGLPPSHMRSVAMVPLIFFAPALGLHTVVSWLVARTRNPHHRETIARLCAAHVCVLFLTIGGLLWRDYRDWGARADLFYDSDGDLNLAAGWLAQHTDPDDLMFIWSTYYEHPTVLAHPLDSTRIRWLMAEHLILPPPDRDAVYILPRSVQPLWDDLLAPYALDSGTENIPLGADGQPAFAAYRIDERFSRIQSPLQTNFGNVIRLIGGEFPDAKSGESARVTLHWEILNAPGRNDLAPLVVLTDMWGNEIARENVFVEQSERWQAGERFVHRVELPIPAGNPPGGYEIKVAWVGKSHANDYLPTLNENGAFAGVWLNPGRVFARAGDIQPSQSVDMPNPLILEQADIPNRVEQGDRMRLSLVWRAIRPDESDVPIRFVLEGADDTREPISDSITLHEGGAVGGTYPLTLWRPGERVIDRHMLSLPHDLPAGMYQLAVYVGETRYSSTPLEVIAVPRVFDVPEVQTRLNYLFIEGNAIGLIGYDFAQEADQMTLRLVWRAVQVPNADYTVFVHVLNPDGSIYRQVDAPPSRNTSRWVQDEVISDVYTLQVPQGEYTVAFGLYDQNTGARLSVFASDGGVDAQRIGDAVIIVP
jgi:hypothetical protein